MGYEHTDPYRRLVLGFNGNVRELRGLQFLQPYSRTDEPFAICVA